MGREPGRAWKWACGEGMKVGMRGGMGRPAQGGRARVCIGAKHSRMQAGRAWDCMGQRPSARRQAFRGT
eukprot:57691-Chlamydomonas_euryale.AAC.1